MWISRLKSIFNTLCFCLFSIAFVLCLAPYKENKLNEIKKGEATQFMMQTEHKETLESYPEIETFEFPNGEWIAYTEARKGQNMYGDRYWVIKDSFDNIGVYSFFPIEELKDKGFLSLKDADAFIEAHNVDEYLRYSSNPIEKICFWVMYLFMVLFICCHLYRLNFWMNMLCAIPLIVWQYIQENVYGWFQEVFFAISAFSVMWLFAWGMMALGRAFSNRKVPITRNTDLGFFCPNQSSARWACQFMVVLWGLLLAVTLVYEST